jgi:stringent starvation protein B
MTPLKLYLVRAVYDWAVENGLTPHLIVDAGQAGVRVPSASVQEGKIVLNIAPRAVQAFALDDQSVRFSARFGGKPFNIECPIVAVRAIYARENGQGVAFPETEEPAAPDPQSGTPTPVPRKGPVLKRIK